MIYCKDCKWLITYMTDEQGNPKTGKCIKGKQGIIHSWYESITEYGKCEEINKNNDCKWHEVYVEPEIIIDRKWYQFWIDR